MTFEISEEKVRQAAKMFRRSKSVIGFLFPDLKINLPQSRILRERAYSIRKVERVVCEYFCTDIDTILRRGRAQEHIVRRSILFYTVYTYADMKGEYLAKRYGYDRSSIIHHANVVLGQLFLENENSYRRHAENVYKNLTSIT